MGRFTPYNFMQSENIYIIDAHGFLHRNYHALPKLTTSKGEEVGALYGFVNWLIKFLKEYKPQYVAVCFDSKGPTNRHLAYADYKANRPPTDEALVRQLQIARELVESLGLKVVARQGAEADDLMATITEDALKEKFSVLLITADKDSYQLLNDEVKIWSGILKEKPKDKSICQNKFGVPCSRLTDFLAIVGDSSDNVPGIRGVGPKTAAELINKYGTLEDIIKEAEQDPSPIKPAVVKKILDDKKNALLSKQLVILDRDLPLGLKMKDFKIVAPQRDAVLALTARFEFKNLNSLLEAPIVAPAAPKAPVQGDLFDFAEMEQPQAATPAPEGILKELALEEVLDAAPKAGRIFLYTEEEFLCAATSGEAYSFTALESIDGQLAAKIAEIVSDGKILKFGHDIKFTLRNLSYEPQNGKFINCFDIALAKYCIDPAAEFSLTGILALNAGVMISPLWTLKQRMEQYAKNIWDLKENMEDALKSNNQYEVFDEMEIPLMSVLLDMEDNGIMVDTAWLKTLDILLTKEMQTQQQEINSLAGGNEVNVNSPKQLGVLLFEQLKLPYARKTKTGYSTDEEVLTSLLKIHPIAQSILKYRESAKLKSTYVDSLLALANPQTHRVHTNFNQTGTVTGRLSSFSPNLQNIPVRTDKGRLIRQAFIAGEGNVLLSVDYSQIDLRVLAHESGDETLINAFKHSADIHTQTAAEVFGVTPSQVTKEQRSSAKAINFGIVYGQGPMALAQSLNISMREAKEYIDAYFARYGSVKEWINQTAQNARKAGYVKTLFGHIRYLPEFETTSAQLNSFANRASVNTVVQGGSSDIIKKAMLDIYAAPLAEDTKLLLQVHDELIFEVPKEKLKTFAAFVIDKMQNAVKLKVPLVADAKAGKNWSEMHQL